LVRTREKEARVWKAQQAEGGRLPGGGGSCRIQGDQMRLLVEVAAKEVRDGTPPADLIVKAQLGRQRVWRRR